MKQIVKYCSESVKEIFQERGPFKFKKSELPKNSKSLEKRTITQIDDKTYYLGEWNKNDSREGRGVLVKDGSIYEGFWKNDNENGVGRFINQSGDVY